MEAVFKWFVYFFPKENLKMLWKEIDFPNNTDPLLKRYIRILTKRTIVIYACWSLMCYKIFMSFLGFIAGKYLMKYQIVPYQMYQPGEVKEDPGVTEMRALLRGEDCFDYNLDQSQLRTSLPGDVNPYQETYLVSFHYRALIVITRLLESLKKHEEPFAQSFNGLFSWFDKLIVGYLKSELFINKRD